MRADEKLTVFVELEAMTRRALAAFAGASTDPGRKPYRCRSTIVQSDGKLLSLPNGPKPKGNYTGERFKTLRPEIYRRVVELLAEPREHISIREICR